MDLITNYDIQPSFARTREPNRAPVRIALVQQRYHPDPVEHREALNAGITAAAAEGAHVVCLSELTLSPYFCFNRRVDDNAQHHPEDLLTGPTLSFAATAARANRVFVHTSLWERAPLDESGVTDGLGYNTAILVDPNGALISRTRKLHIPRTAGYYEHEYFRPGPATDQAYRVVPVDIAGSALQMGFPTCWDQWFPELARAYSLGGADLLVYPTAIGSEPNHPGFDTQPLWEKVIVGNGVANGLFMVVPNRFGSEGPLTFYGSSFISDPYGRILVQAPRDRAAVLVADIDLDQRRDWLALFPFLATRRPDTYGTLLADRTVSERSTPGIDLIPVGG